MKIEKKTSKQKSTFKIKQQQHNKNNNDNNNKQNRDLVR